MLPQIGFQTSFPIEIQQKSTHPAFNARNAAPKADFITFGQAQAISIDPVARVGHPRNAYVPGAFDMEDRVNLYETLIPGAGQMLPKSRLADLDQDYTDDAYNRRERVAVFYLLSALAELASPAVNPDMQIERLRQILIAIENKATEKVAPRETATHRFTEDPRIMKAQVGDRQAFRLQGNRIVSPGYKISKGSTAFPESDSVLVIPSTWEYMLIDKSGRVMVIRMDASHGRNYPYQNLKPEDINEALQSGDIVLNIPKNGTDFLDRKLSGIYIAPEWQVSAKQVDKLQERQKQQILSVLSQIPIEPFEES